MFQGVSLKTFAADLNSVFCERQLPPVNGNSLRQTNQTSVITVQIQQTTAISPRAVYLICVCVFGKRGHRQTQKLIFLRNSVASISPAGLNTPHQHNFGTNLSSPVIIKTLLLHIFTEVWKNVNINLLDKADSTVKTDI